MPSEAPGMDQALSTWQKASGAWDAPDNTTQDAQTQDTPGAYLGTWRMGGTT